VINADNKNISIISAQNIVVKQLAACSCAEACFCLIFWTLNFAYALHSNVISRLILCLLNCATYLHNRLQWIKLNNLGEMWKPIPPGQMLHTYICQACSISVLLLLYMYITLSNLYFAAFRFVVRPSGRNLIMPNNYGGTSKT
jgi:hypothetical protein